MFLHPDVILHMEFLKLMKCRRCVCVCVCVSNASSAPDGCVCVRERYSAALQCKHISWDGSIHHSLHVCVSFFKVHLAEIFRETRARLLWRLRAVLVFQVAAEVRKTLGMMDYNAETVDRWHHAALLAVLWHHCDYSAVIRTPDVWCVCVCVCLMHAVFQMCVSNACSIPDVCVCV